MLWRETAFVNLFGLAKVPFIAFVGPRVMSLDEHSCTVKIPLRWRTRNHVGGMYIAVLTVGAELAAGVYAMSRVRKNGGAPVVPIFKAFQADYLKRPDGDVVFRCDDGPTIGDAVNKAVQSGERVTIPVKVIATVPDKYGAEPVARFTLSLSLKRQAAAR